METSLESNFTPAAAFRVYRLSQPPPGTFPPHNQNFIFSLVRAPKFALNVREGFAIGYRMLEGGGGGARYRVSWVFNRRYDSLV